MTIFCNPASLTNGTGTLLDPKNTWAGQDWSVDNDFAQIAEVPLVSTTTNAANPNVSGTVTARKTLRSYEPGTGNPTTRKAVIVGSGAVAQNGINFANNVGYWNVQDFDISNLGAANTYSHGISTAQSPTVDSGPMFTTIERCEVHDMRDTGTSAGWRSIGINMRGRGNIIRNCTIYRVAVDGIFFRGLDTLIEENVIYDTNWFGGNEADCIQSTVDCGGSVIRNNYLDGSLNAGKQVIIVAQQTGTKPVLIYGNVIIGGPGFAQNIYTDAVTHIFDNDFYDGGTQIRANAAAVITGNRFYNRKSLAPHYGVWCEFNGVTVANNIFRNYMPHESIQYAIRCENGDAANVLRNNLITGYRVGISLDESVGQAESYNWIHGASQPLLGVSVVPTLGTGSSLNDWTPYVDELGRHKIPPGITLATLGTASPIANAGTYMRGVRLANGRLRPNLKPIGPYAPVFVGSPV